MLDIVLAAQTDEGRWIKRYGTRALQVEERGQPSKWITIRALRAVKHTWQASLQADLTEMRNRVSWFDGIG